MKTKVIQSEEFIMKESRRYNVSTLINYHQDLQKMLSYIWFFSSIIYFRIYIVIHRQICFVLSELISVTRQYLPVAGIETRLTQTPSQSF